MHVIYARSGPGITALTHAKLLDVRRIELCREDGSPLRTVLIDECIGAPHEFRGVYRGGLLRVLQSAVPRDCIHYGCAVSSMDQDDAGTDCDCMCISSQRAVLQIVVADCWFPVTRVARTSNMRSNGCCLVVTCPSMRIVAASDVQKSL